MPQFMVPMSVLLIGLLTASPALPCSRVLWVAADGQVFVGRTQDWTEKAGSAFRVYPRGIERTGAVAENPHKWTSKYGSLVVTGYNIGTTRESMRRGYAPTSFTSPACVTTANAIPRWKGSA
ncbi:hypothetical protein ETAA8_43630 [Anatilimnocola aggregata]|uniref:Uncharacterized protein n=1 Tax=Anatilimnocola aggregata TaxID=2528021 RepID=A0A517YGA8_9BACT|nr:hypothetical protein ETAA8_43630 [Anatilimnocola aggregata]